MSKLRSIYSGFGLTGTLTMVFIALKLAGIIGWSWWLVLSPIPLALFIMMATAAVYACWELRRGDSPPDDGEGR